MWQLFIITAEGRKVPHWSANTRHECRVVARGMRPLPRKVRTKIERAEGTRLETIMAPYLGGPYLDGEQPHMWGEFGADGAVEKEG